MSGDGETHSGQRLLGFPPRSNHILLPERPASAARAALALYDATLLHQRVAAVVGGALLHMGLGPYMRVKTLPDQLDQGWWCRWCREVGHTVVGDVDRIAFRIWEDRVAGLLFDRNSRPMAFLKVWRSATPPSPGHSPIDLQADAIAALTRVPTTTFSTPAIIARGFFDGLQYIAFEPLPPGRHRRLAPEPECLHSIVDEIQARLARLDRPSTVPAHHVMSHGDLTPRNLRVASDGTVCLFDWEYARWAPRLADELRFWVTDGALRSRSRPEHHGRRITSTLLQRGSREDVAEALAWDEYITPREAEIRTVVAREMSRA